MTSEQFADLVMRFEGESRRNPRGYRLRAGLMACLGYAYILLILSIALSLLGLVVYLVLTRHARGAGAIKAAFALLILCWILLRALWVSWPVPQGIELRREQAPKLFEEVEAIQRRLAAPRVHHIYANGDFNAAMEEHPRLGIFGWPKGILHVGIPLMQALAPEQFRAVLAHELGHLSGNHGRFTGWLYRVRTAWIQLLAQLESAEHWSSGIFTRFAKWYSPLLNAYAFVVARAHEYEADRCAAEVAGKRAAAEALTAISVKGKFMESAYWPGLYDKVKESAAPGVRPYQQMHGAFQSPKFSAGAGKWLTSALAESTGYVDTHPCLRERLAALGEKVSAASLPGAASHALAAAVAQPQQTAADYYLGRALPGLIEQLDREWSMLIEPAWKEKHAEFLEKKAELEKKLAEGAASDVKQQFELALLMQEVRGEPEAEPLFRRVLEMDAKHVGANFLLGRILLERDEAAGVEFVKQAMAEDPACATAGCALLADYYTRLGSAAEAEKFQRRGFLEQDAIEAAREERSRLPEDAVLQPHDWTAEAVQKLHAHLQRYYELQCAYLVRREVEHLAQNPCYVLALVPKRKWYKTADADVAAEVQSQVAMKAPMEDGTVVFIVDKQSTLRKRLRKTPGALVFGEE